MRFAVTFAALSLSLLGCEQKKDTVISPIAPADYKLPTGGGGGGGGGVDSAQLKALEARVAMLEGYFAKKDDGSTAAPAEARLGKLESYQEELDFLREVYNSQPKKPAKDICAAVDISENLRLGAVEGPANAPITIIEAFDFA